MPKRTAAYTVPKNTQTLFIGLGALSVLMQVAILAYWAISQYSSNHNLSAYLLPLAIGVVAPVAFFATAYWLRRRPGVFRTRAFDAVLFTTLGLITSSVLEESTVFYQRLYVFNGGYWSSVVYTLAPVAVAYVLYLILLLRYGD